MKIKISLIIYVLFLCINRMESTEKCEAVIGHFNGKFIKTPPGVSGMLFVCPDQSHPPGGGAVGLRSS